MLPRPRMPPGHQRPHRMGRGLGIAPGPRVLITLRTKISTRKFLMRILTGEMATPKRPPPDRRHLQMQLNLPHVPTMEPPENRCRQMTASNPLPRLHQKSIPSRRHQRRSPMVTAVLMAQQSQRKERPSLRLRLQAARLHRRPMHTPLLPRNDKEPFPKVQTEIPMSAAAATAVLVIPRQIY